MRLYCKRVCPVDFYGLIGYTRAVNQSDIDRFYVQLGERIRRARRRNPDFSQSALAKILEMSRTSVVNIEKGRQRIQVHTLHQIASALKANPEDLLPTESVSSGVFPEEITSKVSARELPSVAKILSALNIHEDATNGPDKIDGAAIARESEDQHPTRRSGKGRKATKGKGKIRRA